MTEPEDHDGDAQAYDADSEPVLDPAQLGLGEDTILGGGGPRISASEEYIELSEPDDTEEK